MAAEVFWLALVGWLAGWLVGCWWMVGWVNFHLSIALIFIVSVLVCLSVYMCEWLGGWTSE